MGAEVSHYRFTPEDDGEPYHIRYVGQADTGRYDVPEGLYEVPGLLTARDLCALGMKLMQAEARAAGRTTSAMDHADACRGGRLEVARGV